MPESTTYYAMGRSANETRRLMLQSELYAEHTDHLLVRAGLAPGMRVLEVGCGAGDVSMQAARLVGPTGSVIGIDTDAEVLAVARRRTAEAGITTVTYQQSNIADVRLDEPVDALIGRLILIHLPDPVSAVRELSRFVRPGGMVSFQDFNISRFRSVPPLPLVTACLGWIYAASRAGGLDLDAGGNITAVLSEAGLRTTGTASSTPSGDADSPMYDYTVATIASLRPLIEKHGIATAEELDLDTLATRLRDEARAGQGVLHLPELVGSWAAVPTPQ